VDRIGVVREHRWIRADAQAERLKPRCRVVVSLGGGKAKQVDLDGLVMLARPGTTIELVHAFLLAEPKRKRLSGGMRKDFRAALAALEKRGAQVFDVAADIGSDKRVPFLAVVDADIGRSNRSRSSAANGAHSKRGRQKEKFTPAQKEKAGDIWGNTKRYPEEADTAEPLARILSEKGRPVTVHRARREFGNRT
jgi:hypothetical protein